MFLRHTGRCLLAMSGLALAATTMAAPVEYKIDPEHTFPSFEADHMGLSTWRGKLNETRGKVVLDRAAKKGSVDLTMKIASIDFGHEGMNKHARASDIFDAAKYPEATYKGTFSSFDKSGNPLEVKGDLTLRGVTKPVTLKIERFKCMDPHPMNKAETCGADAFGEFKRSDFGVNFGLDMGFSPEVKLRIQVEAIKI